MILLKILIMILIILITSYIGFEKARLYEKRIKELNNLQSSLLLLKNKIKFTHEPLKIIFKDISKLVYDNNENIYLNVLKNDSCSLYDSWKGSVENFKCSLTNRDKEILKTFGKTLGTNNIEGEILDIEYAEKLLGMQLKEAEKEKQVNSKMYKSLGIICGLVVCIILI